MERPVSIVGFEVAPPVRMDIVRTVPVKTLAQILAGDCIPVHIIENLLRSAVQGSTLGPIDTLLDMPQYARVTIIEAIVSVSPRAAHTLKRLLEAFQGDVVGDIRSPYTVRKIAKRRLRTIRVREALLALPQEQRRAVLDRKLARRRELAARVNPNGSVAAPFVIYHRSW